MVYDEYSRQYYQKNKDRIREKTRAYKKAYNEAYYEENRERLLEKAKIRNAKRDPKKRRNKYKKSEPIFQIIDRIHL